MAARRLSLLSGLAAVGVALSLPACGARTSLRDELASDVPSVPDLPSTPDVPSVPDAPIPMGVVQLAAGGSHTCALLGDGTARCWGANSVGQLGDGTATQRDLPVAVQGLDGVVALAAGGFHTCAVRLDGRVRCWGSDSYGQLGSSDHAGLNSLTPAAVAYLTNAVSVSAGYLHTCATLADGALWCWGNNNDGQVGDGTTTHRALPVPVSAPGSAAVSAGSAHTCAASASGALRCWGSNQRSQLGLGTSAANRTTPTGIYTL